MKLFYILLMLIACNFIKVDAMQTADSVNYISFRQALDAYCQSDPEDEMAYATLLDAFELLNRQEKHRASIELNQANVFIAGTDYSASQDTEEEDDDSESTSTGGHQEPQPYEDDEFGQVDDPMNVVQYQQQIVGSNEFKRFLLALNVLDLMKTGNNFREVLRLLDLIADAEEKAKAEGFMQAAIRDDLDRQTIIGQEIDQIYTAHLEQQIEAANQETEEAEALILSLTGTAITESQQKTELEKAVAGLTEQNAQLRDEEGRLSEELEKRQENAERIRQNSSVSVEDLEKEKRQLQALKKQLEEEIAQLEANK